MKKSYDGEIYGNIQLLYRVAKRTEHSLTTYRFKCLLCGKEFTTARQNVVNYPSGCTDCRKIARDNAIMSKLKVGEVYGNQKVLEITGVKKVFENAMSIHRDVWAKCKCKNCGAITEIPHRRLILNPQNCSVCSQENLKIARGAYADMGTSLVAIDGRRSMSEPPRPKLRLWTGLLTHRP